MSPLPSLVVFFLGLVLVASAKNIPRLGRNLAQSAVILEAAVKKGDLAAVKKAVGTLLANYHAMEEGVELAYKAAGGGNKNEKEAKEKAEKYYAMVDQLWKDGVNGKEAAGIKARDLAHGAVSIARKMLQLTPRLDFSLPDDVDVVLAHAEAILLMGEDLELVMFGKGDEASDDSDSDED